MECHVHLLYVRSSAVICKFRLLSLSLPLPVTLNQQVVHRLPPHLSAGPFHSIPLGSVTACRSPAIVNVIYGHHHRIIHFPFASLWTGSSSTSTSGRMSLAEDQLICQPHHQTASQPDAWWNIYRVNHLLIKCQDLRCDLLNSPFPEPNDTGPTEEEQETHCNRILASCWLNS